MNHPSPTELEAYVMDLLSPAESEVLEQHVSTCAECTAKLQAEAKAEEALYEFAALPKQAEVVQLPARPRFADRAVPARRVAAVAAVAAAFGAIAASLVAVVIVNSQRHTDERPMVIQASASNDQGNLDLNLYEETVPAPPVGNTFQSF